MSEDRDKIIDLDRKKVREIVSERHEERERETKKIGERKHNQMKKNSST